jgi:hypothetical protein
MMISIAAHGTPALVIFPVASMLSGVSPLVGNMSQIKLKGQCHEIFDPPFFRQSITHRPLINTLKYFRILFRIRRAISENVLIPRYAA